MKTRISIANSVFRNRFPPAGRVCRTRRTIYRPADHVRCVAYDTPYPASPVLYVLIPFLIPKDAAQLRESWQSKLRYLAFPWRHNGPTFAGRHRAYRLSVYRTLDAGPVHCSVWLFGCVRPSPFPKAQLHHNMNDQRDRCERPEEQRAAPPWLGRRWNDGEPHASRQERNNKPTAEKSSFTSRSRSR